MLRVREGLSRDGSPCRPQAGREPLWCQQCPLPPTLAAMKIPDSRPHIRPFQAELQEAGPETCDFKVQR